MKNEIAKTISTVTNPPILCIPLFLIISVLLANTLEEFVLYEAISLIFASVLPMVIILHWAKKSGNDKDISNRQDRFTPLIVGTVSYFIGFIVSFLLNVDIFLTVLLLCYSINTFIVMIITTKWKISIHTTGLSGPSCALIILAGLPAALIGLVFPILIWSRVTLDKHTMAQAVTGGVQGYFLTALEMYGIFSYFNIILNIRPLASVIWFILAIITIPVILGFLSYLKVKILYLLVIIAVVLFALFSPINALLIFVLSLIVSILISYYAGEDFLWCKVIKGIL